MALDSALKVLRSRYGSGALPEPRDPFALIVWENVAYLVDDVRRGGVFARLRKLTGIKPAAILAVSSARLQEAIRDGGMQQAHRAAKVKRCAEIVIEEAGGELVRALGTLPLNKARVLLKRFPGIADPGADKILLLCGFATVPSLDSNGLRVLGRLGLITEYGSYARMYRAGVTLLNGARLTRAKAISAFALLREHGRELCKRTSPVCPACPLQRNCAYAMVRNPVRRA